MNWGDVHAGDWICARSACGRQVLRGVVRVKAGDQLRVDGMGYDAREWRLLMHAPGKRAVATAKVNLVKQRAAQVSAQKKKDEAEAFRRRMLAVMRRAEGAMRLTDLAKNIGRSAPSAYQHLKVLVDEKKVAREGIRYRAVRTKEVAA